MIATNAPIDALDPRARVGRHRIATRDPTRIEMAAPVRVVVARGLTVTVRVPVTKIGVRVLRLAEGVEPTRVAQ